LEAVEAVEEAGVRLRLNLLEEELLSLFLHITSWGTANPYSKWLEKDATSDIPRRFL
jgi:hypothetical protein